MEVRQHRTPKTVHEAFQDHQGRRQGMLRALTTERKKLHHLCHPAEENLSLYSYPDGSWEVSKPADEIPCELPEPCLGINFARDGMTFKQWLCLVATHSDAWLVAVAFFYTVKFNKQQRAELFNLMNEHPTLLEVVSGRASPKENGSARSGATDIFEREEPDEEFEDMMDEGEVDEEQEKEEKETYCGACQESFSSSNTQFWIQCDVCNRWFHGTCVKITSAKAQYIDKYTCPFCTKKRLHPRQGKQVS